MQAMPRDQLVTDWVASRFPDQSVEITPASADASFRRYFRELWKLLLVPKMDFYMF